MTNYIESFFMKIFILITFSFIFIGCNNSSLDIPKSNLYVWSHNDYEQDKPLYTALDLGFQMIEADIHLINKQLYVTHDHPENLDETPLLENLYLKPLEEIINQNGGKVIPESFTTFYLIIDIKTEAESTYKALIALIESYKKLFYRKVGGEWIDGPISLLISGNRPVLNSNSDDRIGFLDGRISDVGMEYPSDLYPLISDNWNNYFSWDGSGQITDEELNKVRNYVQSVHQEDKIIRFWATPDREEMWKMLIENGVDVINIDDLNGMRNFLDREYPDLGM